MAKTEIIISAQDKTKQAFNSVRGSLNGLSGYANTLNNTLGALGGLSTILGASSFTAFLKGGIDTLDMLGDLSDRTGVAASTLAGFQLVAAQSDTSLEALGKGINKLSIYMAENAEQAKQLGITAKDPAEAFIQLSTVLAGIEDTQKRAAVANKILGKSYQELLPALLQGGDALRNQIDAGKEYAGVTEQSVQQAQAFNDQMDKLGVMAKGLGVSLATDLLPNFTDIISAMRTAADEAGTLTALWVGLGGLGDLVFNGTKIHQAKTAVEELNAEIKTYEEVLNSKADKPLAAQYIKTLDENLERAHKNKQARAASDMAAAKEKLKRAQGDLDALTNPTTPTTAVVPKTSTSVVDKLIGGGSKSTSTKKNPAIEEAARFVESLQKQVAVLDLNKSQLLAYDAAQLKLNATQKQTVNGLIDVIATREQLAKDDEAWAEQAKLNTQFDDEQLRMMEEASAAEIEQQETRQRNYEEMAAQLALTNEDLNIDLIASDKARAKAQLDLEHARAIARIESMGLEADEAQNLIEQETERYELSRKKIEQGLNKTKSISEELGVTFKSAFEDAVVGGEGFGDVLKGLEQDIIRLAARKTILDPLLSAFDQLLSGGSGGGGSSIFDDLIGSIGSFFNFNAKGGVYNSPSLSQFSGGVYNRPQAFTFAKGAGIFGEAGPEAIMPLSRGADGKLGVKANGGSGVNVTVNLIESPGNGGQVNQRQEGENITLEIMVEKIEGLMGKNISKGRGIAGTIERQYGLSRAAGAY